MSGKIRNAYMIREEGVGWSKKVHDLGKRKDILEAMTTFNKKKCWTRCRPGASYSIATCERKTDTYIWRGAKYGIHSCHENDGHNGILVVIVFSDKPLDKSTIRKLVDSYYYAKGTEWDELFAKLREDAKFVKVLKKNLSNENECLSEMISHDRRYITWGLRPGVGEIESMSPGEILRPKNFAKVKKLIRKSAQSPYSNRS